MDVAYRRFFLPRMHLVGVCVYPRHNWSAHPRATVAFLLPQGGRISVVKVDAGVFLFLQQVAIAFEYLLRCAVGSILEYLIVIEDRLNVFGHLRPFSFEMYRWPDG